MGDAVLPLGRVGFAGIYRSEPTRLLFLFETRKRFVGSQRVGCARVQMGFRGWDDLCQALCPSLPSSGRATLQQRRPLAGGRCRRCVSFVPESVGLGFWLESSAPDHMVVCCARLAVFGPSLRLPVFYLYVLPRCAVISPLSFWYTA